MAKILITGCGDIGMALARVLAAGGHQVTGLKRKSPATPAGGIHYIAADISVPGDHLDDLPPDFDIVYFIVAPDGRNEQGYRAVYESGVNNLLAVFSRASSRPRWIFVSSTSVYGQSQGEWVDENSIAQPAAATSQLIRQAEQTLTDLDAGHVVVRFSGIYGPGRESLLRMARDSPAVQQNPPRYTNRIHQQDCVGVLAFLLERHLAGVALEPCYLASDDDPAPMWEVMSWLAECLSCPPPVAKSGGNHGGMNKRCSNQRLKALGYRFRYPGFRDGYLELIKGAERREHG
jgi:nucleoside-diphosphate-sugar epimerase